ncbi:hypothetical protein D3C73_1069610 [compost metagenome]
MVAAGGQRHHARTAAQGTLCTQENGPTKTAIPANQQDMAELAFMSARRATLQTRQVAGRQSTRTDVDALERLRRRLQIIEHQLSNHIRRAAREQSQLQTDERHRQVGPHRHTQYPAGIGTQPRR